MPQPLPKRAAAACRQFEAFRKCQRIKMSRRASGPGRAPGGGIKRNRQHGPASLEVTVHAVVVKSYLDMLVCAQLCNSQGLALFSFVRLPPCVPRTFAGATLNGMTLMYAERLRAVGCGLKGKLVRLLSLGTDCYFEPRRNWRACHKLVRHVASGLAAAVRDKNAIEAEELCASGQCAAAVVPLQKAIYLGHLSSLALKAWLLINGREGFVAKSKKRGREGVAKTKEREFELVAKGNRLGCKHCQGVMAFCYLESYGCEYNRARSLELALESSRRGSKYGQHTLGKLHILQNRSQALAFYRLAALQGLDEAQYSMGSSFFLQDWNEGLRWYQLAAAQGHPEAMCIVACCHQRGHGVAVDVDEAIRLYMRARAAGSKRAARELNWLGA
jgi:TPR repeat protein